MSDDNALLPFATVEDLEARWHSPLTEDERRRATAALDDASALIRDECERADVKVGTMLAQTLKAVCASMVIRKLSTDDKQVGVSQTSETAGPFGQSWTFANPTGDLFLTAAERKRLGLRKQHAFTFNSDSNTTPRMWWR